MKLRFASRSDAEDSVVHLVVADALHCAGLLRARGQALCRRSLPNLEPLDVQILGTRRCCGDCVEAMARVRRRQRVDLPVSAGVLAVDLIRERARDRATANPRERKPARTFMESPDQ